jgi:hypothetical protein
MFDNKEYLEVMKAMHTMSTYNYGEVPKEILTILSFMGHPNRYTAINGNHVMTKEVAIDRLDNTLKAIEWLRDITTKLLCCNKCSCSLVDKDFVALRDEFYQKFSIEYKIVCFECFEEIRHNMVWGK